MPSRGRTQRPPAPRSRRRPVDDGDSVSEAEIAVHWKEEEPVGPPADLAASLGPSERALRARFARLGFPECFRVYADLLTWEQPWTRTLDDSRPPFYRWFVGGRLNASFNCIDRHARRFPDRAAFRFVPEPPDEPVVTVTYRSLQRRVEETASFLRERAGVRMGDRVTIHLPMTPELPVTMLACARIGAVHSVVFAGFSGEACGRRIADSGSRVLVTMDAFWRNGRLLDHRPAAELAIATAAQDGQSVDHVLVWERYPGRYSSRTPPVTGRDALLPDALLEFAGRRVPPEPMPSEAPLFLMYTSGTTGRPKGVQHGTGGYLSYTAGTTRTVLDLHPEDVYWCLADIGWITGHSYIVYGPLALGATSVLYEGVPTFPDSGRPWRIAEALNVNVFHTSPTAIRLLRKLGPAEPERYRFRFRILATVGEPIEPQTWRWYYEAVGKRSAAVVDTWWQTETGGILCSTLPGLDAMKPGSTGPPLPGIDPAILDDRGVEVPDGSGRAGNLVLRTPWPGLMQTIWNDPDRFVSTYFARYNTDPKSRDWRRWPYFSGDGATRTADGYLRILGRIDDVINVAGHRLGTKEIESACLSVPDVAEAAVIPEADEVKGRVPVVYVSLRPGVSDPIRVTRDIADAIETQIGKIAQPKEVWVVPEMPKTRSGKIMRRVLSAISNRRDVGDVTTLADPAVVEEIRRLVQGAGAGPVRSRPSDPPRKRTGPR
ncbi:MAG: acetate--CoA ligase [Thermoplasmata archaeon]|nr:acetate--CoA ligase [Thermoplasmata archaeon]MCI4359305.1 acetate--CoA ligase [Thermoplasmata archaeon]